MSVVTCVLCHGPVEEVDTVDMPNGPVCDDPCYKWLEQMMDEIMETEDDDDDEDVD